MNSNLLKVKKDSHSIKKPSSSSSTRPVIIYASPPKVVHTKPESFMELVQKLTGLQETGVSKHYNVNGSCSSTSSISLSPSDASKVPVLCLEEENVFVDRGWGCAFEDEENIF